MLKKIKTLRITLFILLALLIILSLVVVLTRNSTPTSQSTSQAEFINPGTALTPIPEGEIPNTVITLPDGSMIILRPETEIEIVNQPVNPTETDETIVKVLKGEIMVVPNPLKNNWFNVQSSTGYLSRIQGCAMVVNFDGLLTFKMKCIAGYCEIGPDIDELISATTNFTWIYQVGVLIDPVAIDYNELKKDYKDNLPVCVVNAETQPYPEKRSETPAPTVTLTETATPTATSTRKPSPTPTIDLAGTATEACRVFNQEFPSTPCP